MAENLEFRINTDTGQSEKAIVDLSSKIDKLADAIANTQESVNDGFDEVADAVAEVGQSVDELEEVFAGLTDTGVGMIDTMVPGFSGMIRGAQGMTKGMSSLNAVFKASPIGLLIAALGAVVSYFSSSKEGAEKFQVIMSSIDAVLRVFMEEVINPLGAAIVSVFENPMDSINSFVDTVKNYVIGSFNTLMEGAGLLGSAIEKLFSGDFSGAWEDATEGVAKFGEGMLRLNPITAGAMVAIDGVMAAVEAAPALWDKVTSSVDAAATAQGKLNTLNEKIRVTTNANITAQEKLNTAIIEAEDILGRQYATYEERTQALENRTNAMKEQAKRNKELADMEIERIKLEISIQRDYKEREELERELAEATAERMSYSNELMEIERDNAEEQKRLDFEELERRTDILDTLRTREAQSYSERIADREKAELQEADVDYKNDLVRLQRLQATEEEIARLTEAYEGQKLRITTEYGKERQEKTLSLARMLVDLESELMGESVDAERERREMELNMAERDAMLELVELEATEEQKEEVREYYRKLRIKNEKDTLDELRNLRIEATAITIDESLSAGADLLSAIQDFNSDREAEDEASAKRQFEINKKIAKAQVIISTAQGIMGQLAVPQDQLTGMNFVKAATIATAGALQLKTIGSTTFDSSDFGGGFDFDDGGQTPQIDLSFLNQPQNQTELRAYVVQQELSNQNMMREQIKNQAYL